MARRKRRRVAAGADAASAETKVRFLSIYLILFGLGLLVVFSIVHTQVRDNDLRYQIKSLRRTQGNLEKENRQLLALAQELSSPDRISILARSELGMVLPPSRRVAVLHIDGPQPSAADAAAVLARQRDGWFDELLSWLGPEEKAGGTTEGAAG